MTETIPHSINYSTDSMESCDERITNLINYGREIERERKGERPVLVWLFGFIFGVMLTITTMVVLS